MDDPERQVLLTLKSGIIRYGWTQKELQDADGRVCLFGAATSVYRLPIHGLKESKKELPIKGRDSSTFGQDDAYSMPVFSNIGKAFLLLAYQAGVKLDDLAEWQDAPGRTQEEVINLIDDTLAADLDPLAVAEQVGIIVKDGQFIQRGNYGA